MQEYTLQLKDLEDVLDENPGKAWDWEMDPVCLCVCPVVGGWLANVVDGDCRLVHAIRRHQPSATYKE